MRYTSNGQQGRAEKKNGELTRVGVNALFLRFKTLTLMALLSVSFSAQSDIRLWQTENKTTGKMTRAEADAFCQADPNHPIITDATTYAFISLSEDDEIRDLETNYGIPFNVRVYGRSSTRTLAQSMTELLAGGSVRMNNPIGRSPRTWTLSDETGALHPRYSCNLGTTEDNSVYGIYGIGDELSVKGALMKSINSCGSELSLYCISYRQDGAPPGVFEMTSDAAANSSDIEVRVEFAPRTRNRTHSSHYDLVFTGNVTAEVGAVRLVSESIDGLYRNFHYVTIENIKGEGTLRLDLKDNTNIVGTDGKGNGNGGYVKPYTNMTPHVVSFTTTSQSSSFDTTTSTGLSPQWSFSDLDETLVISHGSHLVNSVLDGGAGEDTLEFASAITANLGQIASIRNFEQIKVSRDVQLSLTESQYESLIRLMSFTEPNLSSLTLITPDDAQVTGDDKVHTYRLNDVFDFTLSNAGQTVIGSDGASQTVNVLDFQITGQLDAGEGQNDQLLADSGADLSGATLSGFESLVLANDAEVTLNAAQLNAFTSPIIAPADETLVILGDDVVTNSNLAAVEFFSTSGNGGKVRINADVAHNKTLIAKNTSTDGFIVLASAGEQTIKGSAGNDDISGGSGNDVLLGNEGEDTIKPGAGNDVIRGGLGSDIFAGTVAELNGDSITDLGIEDSVRIEGVSNLSLRNVRFFNNNRLQIDTNNTDFAAIEVNLSLPNNVGDSLAIAQIRTEDGASVITFSPEALPEFDNLNQTHSYVENGAPFVLDADVTVSDSNLDSYNSGQGNYWGSTLSLQRQGTPSAFDVFALQGDSSSLVEGGALRHNGSTYGTVTTNANGKLLLSFNDAATTQAVNAILRDITYRNGSESPVSQVIINWLFNDGRGDTQGTNQTIINITEVNDVPDTLTLSNNAKAEAETGENVLVGVLSATDKDDTPTQFALIAAGSSIQGACGIGHDADNDKFRIDGNQLKFDQILLGGLYHLCIQVADDESPAPATFEKHFVVNVIDDKPPVISEVTAVVTPSNATEPNVVIHSSEAGRLVFTGRCGVSSGLAVQIGDNTLALTAANNQSPLAEGNYSDCRVQVEDGSGNRSETLTLTAFEVDRTNPSLLVNSGNTRPQHNSLFVHPITDIQLDFNEAILMQVGAEINVMDVTNHRLLEAFTATSSTALTGANGGTGAVNEGDLTLTLGSQMVAANQYAVQFAQGAMEDAAGNRIDAITNTATYRFTTAPNLTLTAASNTLEEKGGSVNLIAQLSNNSGQAFVTSAPVQLTLTFTGTAELAKDYRVAGLTGANNILTIGQNQSEANIVISGIDDAPNYDPDETIIASIASNSANLVNPSAVNLTLIDNYPPSVTGVSHSYQITEDVETWLDLSAIVLRDDDHTNLTLTISSSSGLLTSSLTSNAQVQVNGSGTSTLTFSGATTALNALLDQVKAVAITTDLNSNTNLQLTFQANDGVINGTAVNAQVSVTAVNDAPDSITLSQTVIKQSATGENALVADLTATDVDSLAQRFALVAPNTSDAGLCSIGSDQNNDAFTLINTQLKTKSQLDKGSYQVCIQATDDHSPQPSTYEQAFTVTVADDLAPIVVEVTPVASPTNLEKPTVVISSSDAGTIKFSGSCGTDHVNQISIGENTISLTQADNTSLLADGEYDDCGLVVEDIAGNESPAVTLTSFTVDRTSPNLIVADQAVSPVHNSVFVSTEPSITLVFDERVRLASGKSIELFDVTNSRVYETFTATESHSATGNLGSQLSINNQNVTVTLSAPLQLGTQYAVKFAAETLLDEAGNGHSAIVDNTTYRFTTLPELRVELSTPSISEQGGTNSYTAKLLNSEGGVYVAPEALSLSISFTGDASLNTDFTVEGLSGDKDRLIIEQGNNTASFTITSIADAEYDPNETIEIHLSADADKVNIDQVAVARVTITDNFVPEISGVGQELQVTEDTPTALDFTDLVLTDHDDERLTLTVTVDSGLLNLTSEQQSEFEVSGLNTNSLTFTGNKTQLQLLFRDGGLTLTPELNKTDSISLSLTITDGKDQGESVNTSVTVLAVNDAPELISTFDAVFDMTGELKQENEFVELEQGVTMTVTTDSGAWINDNGAELGSENTLYTETQTTQTTTFSFDQAVQVRSLLQFVKGHPDLGTFNYEVSEGAGTKISTTAASVATGFMLQPDDWNQVTSFSITNSEGIYKPGFDTLAFTAHLPLPTGLDFVEETQGDVDLSSFSFNDVDSASLELTIAVTTGGLSAAELAQDATVTVTSENETTLTIKGSLEAINGYLAQPQQIQWLPPVDLQGEEAARLTLYIDDGDGSGQITAWSIPLNVANIDDEPEISGTAAPTVEVGKNYLFTPDVDDKGDKDELSYAIVNKPVWASFDDTSGELSGRPNEGHIATYRDIVITVSDAMHQVDLAAFSIRVTPSTTTEPEPEVNDNNAPIITQGEEVTVVMSEDGQPVDFDLMLQAIDADGDALFWSILNAPHHGHAEVDQGKVNFEPRANFNGHDSFTVLVVDHKDSDRIEVKVKVDAVNDAPSISGQPISKVRVGDDFEFLPNASDIENDTLNFTLSNAPSWLTITPTNGRLFGTPTSQDIGTYKDILLSVSDGQLTTNMAKFSVEVTDENQPPELITQTIMVVEDTPKALTLPEFDSDGDKLTYRIVAQGQLGQLENTEQGLVYNPAQDVNGQDRFVLQATDGELDSEAVTFIVTISAVNDQPLARDDKINLVKTEDDSYRLSVLDNDLDVDGDELVIVQAQASEGTVTIRRGQLLYQANTGFLGTVTLNYQIQDPAGLTADAQVTLVIATEINANSELLLTAPEELTVNATGLFTRVDLGVAKAFDKQGNPVPVRLSQPMTALPVGTTLLHWLAGEGENQVTAVQKVHVMPLVSLSADQVVNAGDKVKVAVTLNGVSPSYPVVVDYRVAGSATEQAHNLQSGQLRLLQGTLEYIEFDVSEQATDGQTIEISLSDELNLGVQNQTTITISKQALAPRLNFVVSQQQKLTRIVSQQQGAVSIEALLQWSQSQQSAIRWSTERLVNQSEQDKVFVFDPAQVETGMHKVTAQAIGQQGEVLTQRQLWVKVVKAYSEFGELDDSDADGTPDIEEGHGDKDQDGIPDYLDPTEQCNVMPEQAEPNTQFLVEAEPGTCLSQGSLSSESESLGLKVMPDHLPHDEDYTPISNVIDFEVYRLDQSSAHIVLPQRQPLPSRAEYRKYNRSQGWYTFVENEHNQIFSAKGEMGNCPPPMSPIWQLGLETGHWCVQLKIQDGGLNDDDGLSNGVVLDPGVIAVAERNAGQMSLVNDSASTKMGHSVEIDVLNNDNLENRAATLITSAHAMLGQVNITEQQTLIYTPAPEFIGSDRILYGVNDGNSNGASAYVDVTVSVNTPPQLVMDSAQVIAGQSVRIDVLANDTDLDGDPLSLTKAWTETGQVTINSDQTLTYTSEPDFTGKVTLDYQVTDGYEFAQGQVVIEVTPQVKTQVTISQKVGGSMNVYWLFIGFILLVLIEYRMRGSRHTRN